MRLLLLFFIATTILYAKSSLMNEENVVALVNGVKITKTDVDRDFKKFFPARYLHSTITDKKMESFKKEVLDELIEKELLFQYAKSIGITFPIDEINKNIEEYKRTFKNVKLFQDTLSKLGWTVDELRNAIYKDKILKKLHDKKIEVNLRENDLRDYYDKNLHKFEEPEKIIAKVIYVKNDPTDPEGRSKAKSRVEEAYKKVKSGEDFSDVASKYSSAMSRIKGGDMGYLHRGMLEPNVEKIAYAMEANTISEIIELDIGFYIVKVDSKSKPNQLSYDSVKEKLAKDLKKKLEKEKKEKLLKRLMSEAVIVK